LRDKKPMKAHRIFATLLACSSLAIFVACGSAEQDDAEDNANNNEQLDESRSQLSDGGSFMVMYSPDPEPIPFNELFDLVVMVHDGEDHSEMLMDADIEVDATMPAHGHGMNTEPSVTREDDGSFLVEGMKFHMRSEDAEQRWEIHIEATHEETTETATFNVMCCGE
jgi:hypothetical protein